MRSYCWTITCAYMFCNLFPVLSMQANTFNKLIVLLWSPFFRFLHVDRHLFLGRLSFCLFHCRWFRWILLFEFDQSFHTFTCFIFRIRHSLRSRNSFAWTTTKRKLHLLPWSIRCFFISILRLRRLFILVLVNCF